MMDGFRPYKKYVKGLLYALLIIAGMYALVKISPFFAPFITAFIISSLIEPLVQFLVDKTRLHRKAAAGITVIIVLLSVGGLLTLLISKLISEARSLADYVKHNDIIAQLNNTFQNVITQANTFYHWLPKEVTDNIGNIASGISTSVGGVAKNVITGTVNYAVSLPEALVFFLATTLSTYFLASDRDRIYGFFQRQLPHSWVSKLTSIKDDLFSALFGYIRAQLILMTITFTELSIGFFIIDIKYALVLALIISIIDAFPILGTGGVLIPWGIYNLITGNYRVGLSLLILYIIVLIIRQLLEPKVLGQQIGVHPLLTLMSMYAGLRLLGFFGLILGPITMLIAKNILTGILKGRTLQDVLPRRE